MNQEQYEGQVELTEGLAMPTQEEATEKIQQLLSEIEERHGIRILFAAESGSRAWGFESPDSDFDVRFVYVHNQPEAYISIQPAQQVFDRENGLKDLCDGVYDFAGWDIIKAMGLFQNSNPSFVEWLDSPIIYREDEDFTFTARRIAEDNISLTRIAYGHHHLAKGNFERYLKDRPEVTYKKYLYVLRSIFCILWIEQFGQVPPTDFERILDEVQADFWVVAEIRDIIDRKAELNEGSLEEPNLNLNDWITDEIDRLLPFVKTVPGKDLIPADMLNPLIHRMVGLHG